MNDRKRSPNYPSMSLPEAIEGVRKFYAAERRTVVDVETAAKALGYNSLNGASRTRIASLKQYGLLTGRGEKMTISDLGLRIVLPSDDRELEEAIREAALTPELFRMLADTHAEASTNAVVSYLVRELRFTDDSARRLDRAFRETVRFAKVEAAAYDDGDNSPQETTMPNAPPQAMLAPALSVPVSPPGSNALAITIPYFGGAVSVQVTVGPTERITRKLMDKVVRMLTLATEDLPDESNSE